MNKTKRSGSSRRLSRRMLGFLLSVVMILGMMPNTAFSAYADETTYDEETTEQLSTDNTELVEEISEETSTNTDTELVEKTTEEPSTGTDTESVRATTEELSTDTDVETNSDEESDMLIVYSTVALGAESAEPLAVALDSEYPADDAPGFCVVQIDNNYAGICPGTEDVNYDYGVENPAFTGGNSTPYWKNDDAHPGKIIPATEEDYNLYYNDGTLYLKGLYLSVTGPWDGGAAISIDEELDFVLTIEIEADSTIVCTNGPAISAYGGSIAFTGSGNLSLVTQGRDCAALQAWSGVYHNGTGVISLEPAHKADVGVVDGNGTWAEDAFPIENNMREFSTDGKPDRGFSGILITKEEFEQYAGWNWNENIVPGLTYGMHGSSVQEVIDMASGEIPVTFTDDSVSGVDITADYLLITATNTNYGLTLREGQYITSTRDFKGIIFYGAEAAQRTNHPVEENGTWMEDQVFEFSDATKDLFKDLVESYGLELAGDYTVNSLASIEYITYTGDEIHVAVENPELSETKQYSYDLGDLLMTNEDLEDAITQYNGDCETRGKEPLGKEYWLDIWYILDGEYYNDSYYEEHGWDFPHYRMTIDNPMPTLHINSQCDFIIGGEFDSTSEAINDDNVNIYFGFLPDTDHKISFIQTYGSDAEYRASLRDEEYNGGRKHRIYNPDGSLDTGRFIYDYTKEDLTNGTIARGTMDVKVSVWGDYGPEEATLRVLMYEHVTEEGTVSGDYSEAVTMDMASIPDGKILGDIDITKEQLVLLETGKSAVDIDLAVNELDTEVAANQTAVTDIASEATKGGYTNPFYMDLNLSASIRNASGNKLAFANGARDIPLTELEKPVEITVELPKEMQSANAGREYAIVRRHVTPDGKVQTEVLTAQYDSKTKSLTFKTDKFSTYAIVYKEEAAPSTGTTTDTGTTAAPGTNATTPGTGDNAPVEVAVVLILATASMMIFSFRKRKMK